jgi:hypothetical protein
MNNEPFIKTEEDQLEPETKSAETGWFETLNVAGDELVETVNRLLHDVSVHRLVVRKPDGSVLVEIPAWAGGLGALVFLPYALIVAGVALLAQYRLEVFRKADGPVSADRGPVEELIVDVDTPAPPMHAAADDLTAIKGVGPRYAAALNAAGITTFAQVAAMEAEALRTVLVQAALRPVPNTSEWPARAALLHQA